MELSPGNGMRLIGFEIHGCFVRRACLSMHDVVRQTVVVYCCSRICVDWKRRTTTVLHYDKKTVNIKSGYNGKFFVSNRISKRGNGLQPARNLIIPHS